MSCFLFHFGDNYPCVSCLHSTSCLCLSPPHFSVFSVSHWFIVTVSLSLCFLSVLRGLWIVFPFSFFPLGTFLCLPWWHLWFWTSVYLSAYHWSSLFVPQPSVGVFGDGLLMPNPPFFTLDRIGNRINKAPPTRSGNQVSCLQVSSNVFQLSFHSLCSTDKTWHTAHLTSGCAACSDATGEQTSEGSVGCEVFKSDDESNLEDKQQATIIKSILHLMTLFACEKLFYCNTAHVSWVWQLRPDRSDCLCVSLTNQSVFEDVRVYFAEEMFALSTLTYFTQENNESSVRCFSPLFVFPQLSKQAHPTANSDKPRYRDGDSMVRGCKLSTRPLFVFILSPRRAPG